MSTENDPGLTLPEHNSTSIVHISAGVSKSPFASIGIPLIMHQLDPGTGPQPGSSTASTFSGQFGLIDFDVSIRLPRHVHIAPISGTLEEEDDLSKVFVTERILVLDGVALVELNGRIYVVPPRTLVTIAPGVPHTWSACPAGVSFSEAAQLCGASVDRTRITKGSSPQPEPLPNSTGSFLMVYEYEEVTGFFPTEQVETIRCTDDYVRCDDLENIRFPQMGAQDVYDQGYFIWGREIWHLI